MGIPGWSATIATVIYIALIGIFAIEEINSREGASKLLAAQQTEILGRLAQSPNDEALKTDRAKLLDLQTRLAILVTDGAGALGTPATLKAILCELDKIHERNPICPVPEIAPTAYDKVVTFFASVLLEPLGARSGTGEILAILIVTAAFGGALIRLSLDNDGEPIARTCLRAIGGGIVCYLVLVGGAVPLATVDFVKPSSPATASLIGLLSGMFSNKLFHLVSDFVDAFVTKVTPGPAEDPTAPTEEVATADVAGQPGE